MNFKSIITLFFFGALFFVGCQKNQLDDLVPTQQEGKKGDTPDLATSCDPKFLAEKYAPQFRLYTSDPYRPSSAEWYLDRTQMRFHRQGQSDLQILNMGQISNSNIHNRYKEGQYSGKGYQSDFFLQIPNSFPSELITRFGSTSSVKVYVNVRMQAYGSNLEIQYWIFYPYNGPMWGFGTHEGDWEHITVQLNGTCGGIKKIYYAAHGTEGKWYYPGQFTLVSGTHPVVYSSKHSHASYPMAGIIHRNNLPDDHTNIGGPTINSWDDLEIIANQTNIPITGWSPYSVKNWVKFTGRWGEIGQLIGGAWPDGPWGPIVKDAWISDDYKHQNLGIVFYNSNGGPASSLHNATTDAKYQTIELKERRGWSNDDIRSVRIFKAKQGTYIKVYDSPSGSTSDDYTIIYVKQNIQNTYGTLIYHLENSYENSQVRVTHYHKNGLNGKVSRIRIQ